jgi:branched-chain amino acid transport system permease protein
MSVGVVAHANFGSGGQVTLVSDVIDEDALEREAAPAPAWPGGTEPEPTRPSLMDDPRVNRGLTYLAAAVAFYFVQQWFWPAPIGVLVLGVVIGGLTAMIAFGIALIYRANRVINFAQADLGGAPASLAILLIVGRNWPYLLAMATGLAAALVLGAFVEFVIIRRFFKAPRLILTVVTIGLVQLLSVGEIGLPSVFHIKSPPQNFKSPFGFKFLIGRIVFNGNDIVALICVLASIAGLAAFFRFTNTGIAVRGCAESSERAALLGIPVQRINTIVWVMATVLATVGLIMRAGVVGLPIGSALGLPIMVRALAAAVLGRMEKFPTIFVAAVAIGILEQAIVWHTRNGLLVDPILFVVIIAALLFQRRGQMSRLGNTVTSAWQSAKEVRPIPHELVKLPEVRVLVTGVAVALGAFLLVLPVILGEARTVLAATLFCFAIVAVSLVILSGWAGQISLGQFAFVGIGEVIGAWLTLTWHWDLSIVILVGGLVGALAAIVIGIPALRIQGLFLAVATLGFALATSSWLLNAKYMKWIPRSSVRIPRYALFGHIGIDTETRYYYLCLAGLCAALIFVRNLRRGRTGRVLVSVRENDRGAESFGVNVIRTKLTAFALSGFLAAAAGVLLVHLQQNLLTTTFDPQQSVNVFVMVVIGGLGSVPGALFGATYIQGLTWFRSSFPPSIRPLLPFFGGGIGLVIILMFLPGGIASLMYNVRDSYLRWVAKRKGIIVPSLVADVREDSSYAPQPGEPAPWVVTAEPTVPEELKPEAAKAAFDETLLVGVLETLESGEAQAVPGMVSPPVQVEVAGQAMIDLSLGEDVFKPKAKPKPAARKRAPSTKTAASRATATARKTTAKSTANGKTAANGKTTAKPRAKAAAPTKKTSR